jgi:hypothetical protein
VPALISAIEDYLAAHNDEPKPFIWTATAESILAKVARARDALQQVVNQWRDGPPAGLCGVDEFECHRDPLRPVSLAPW